MTGEPPGAAGSGGRRATVRLFGVCLESDHDFVSRLGACDGPAALELRYVSEAPLPAGWERAAIAYSSPLMIDDRQSFLSVTTSDDCTVFRFTEVVDFFIWPDRVLCRVVDPAYAYMVELHFLGFVMAFWLESRGHPALHASAIADADDAIGFLSTNKGGKSSLAASFLRAGHALLTDDILAVEEAGGRYLARPSYPQMRMWPDQAGHFVGPSASLARVHPKLSKRRVPVGPGGFGTFCEAARPLACIYLPERREGGAIDISSLAFADAVFELARYSFLSDVVEGVGLHRTRFATLAGLARAIPVRRIAYPSGNELLPQVVDAIRADVAALRARPAP